MFEICFICSLKLSFLVYCDGDMVRHHGFTPVNFGEDHSISCVMLLQELPDG